MILDNIKSRVKGDLQARFRERLAGETPACLLDFWVSIPKEYVRAKDAKK